MHALYLVKFLKEWKVNMEQVFILNIEFRKTEVFVVVFS